MGNESAQLPVRRLFFGIRPPADVARRLYELARRVTRDGGRPVPPANLHLTLQFLGQVADDGCLAQRAAAIDQAAFTLRLSRLGHFPRARVAWVGPDESPPALRELAQACRRVARRCAVAGDDRDYVPHVTLARKVSRPPAVGRIEPIEWCVTRFQLFWSRSTANGVEYVPLAEFPLRSGDASVPAGEA